VNADLDRFFKGVILRQVPLILASIATGALLIYFIGFWSGVVIHSAGWGLIVFLAKARADLQCSNPTDKFRDERLMLNFLLSLLGRR
jgi:hypothetical protein